jgi:hypothetical protein
MTSKAATERELVQMLRARYEKDSGNGPQAAVLAAVRDAAGFSAQRTIDALAVSFWPSRGLTIDAFECKSSRSDFQRELASPEKAERFCELADRFWIVAGSKDVVTDVAELPAPWGLLVARGGKLVQVKAAQLLHPPTVSGPVQPLPPAFDRGFLISMIRQAMRAGAAAAPQDDGDAYARGVAAGRQLAEHDNGSYQLRYEQLRSDVKQFEATSGIRISQRSFGAHTAQQLGAAVRLIVEGDMDADRLISRFDRLADEAQRLAEHARQHRDRARGTAGEA